MTVKRALAALILSVMATAAASSPKPPGCGTPTTPQCENY